MSELPDGWAVVPLRDLASVRLGKMLDKAKNSGSLTPYLRNVNVRWFSFDLSDVAEMLADGNDRETFSVRKGDLFVCEGGEPGRCAIWQAGDSNLIYQKALHRIRPSAALLPLTLAYQLRLDACTHRLSEYFTGTTIKHLTQESIQRYQVLLPPVQEQKRITERLDAVLTRVDACRDRLAGVGPVLKRFRQSVLMAATTGRLTEDWQLKNMGVQTWRSVCLKDVAGDFSYGSSVKSSPAGSVPVLRMGNIKNGCLDWADLVFTSNADEIAKYKLSPGDVLFNRTNSPELVGKSAVFHGKREAIYAGYLIRVRCSPALLPEYLNYCLGSPAGRHYCWQVKTDGVSQSNINAKKLAAFEFDLPSVEEQQEIVRRVETLFAFADRLETRLQKAQAAADRLTPALLAKAFRGELVPQDPNDEPASELLRRLAARRAQVPVKRGRKKAVAVEGGGQGELMGI